MLGGFDANVFGQQLGGGGLPLIGEATNGVGGDSIALMSRGHHHVLHFGGGFGRGHKGTLAEVAKGFRFQRVLIHQSIGAVGQLNQAIGLTFADFTILQPVQEARAPAITAAFFPIAHNPQNPSPPNIRLQVEAIANAPGIVNLDLEIAEADFVVFRIRQLQTQIRGWLQILGG